MQPPPKAIPPARDRLQSRLLVCAMLPGLCWADILAFRYALSAGHSGRVYLALSVAISLFFALFAWRLRAATAGAATCGAMICLAITVLSGRPEGPSPFHSGLAPLIVLFALTHEATRLGRARKAALGIAETKNGRNAAQIVANLGIAVVSNAYLLSGFGIFMHRASLWPYILATLSLPMLAALAEATADTVSSEIGKAFGGIPILITTFRRVPPGTDGAISIVGTLAGLVGAFIVVTCGVPALGMDRARCTIAFTAATAGLFFDSFLGATLERRGWIGNDAVNFLSTAFAVFLTLAVAGKLGMFTLA